MHPESAAYLEFEKQKAIATMATMLVAAVDAKFTQPQAVLVAFKLWDAIGAELELRTRQGNRG